MCRNHGEIEVSRHTKKHHPQNFASCVILLTFDLFSASPTASFSSLLPPAHRLDELRDFIEWKPSEEDDIEIIHENQPKQQ